MAKAGFDVDVDRRIISVVQLDGPILAGADQPADDSTSDRGQSTDPRIAVDGVAVTRSGPRATAEVRLGRGGAQADPGGLCGRRRLDEYHRGKTRGLDHPAPIPGNPGGHHQDRRPRRSVVQIVVNDRAVE